MCKAGLTAVTATVGFKTYFSSVYNCLDQCQVTSSNKIFFILFYFKQID